MKKLFFQDGCPKSIPQLIAGAQTLHCLDMFGASQRISSCFSANGFSAQALDVLLGGHDGDILTQRGWFNYLDHLLKLRLC